MNWYLKVLKQYADFNGRARRQEYWMFQLFNILIIFGLFMIGVLFRELTGAEDAVAVSFTLVAIYLLAVFIPTLAVVVRRLHDQNKSGWFIFMNFIPWVGGIIMFVFMVSEGTVGSNQYGPDPKNPYSDLEEIGK
jgi:uncharacterized membrane protein YhaH (DUF805 family)